MATSISFDSPQSSTFYNVQTTGTVAAHSTAHVMILLDVTNTSVAHPRSNSYYREVDFANTTFTDTAFHGTYALAIVPKLYGTDTVQATAAWSY